MQAQNTDLPAACLIHGTASRTAPSTLGASPKISPYTSHCFGVHVRFSLDKEKRE